MHFMHNYIFSYGDKYYLMKEYFAVSTATFPNGRDYKQVALAKEFRFTNNAERRELHKSVHDSASYKDRMAIQRVEQLISKSNHVNKTLVF